MAVNAGPRALSGRPNSAKPEPQALQIFLHSKGEGRHQNHDGKPGGGKRHQYTGHAAPPGDETENHGTQERCHCRSHPRMGT
jgi:hypothetical protein